MCLLLCSEAHGFCCPYRRFPKPVRRRPPDGGETWDFQVPGVDHPLQSPIEVQLSAQFYHWMTGILQLVGAGKVDQVVAILEQRAVAMIQKCFPEGAPGFWSRGWVMIQEIHRHSVSVPEESA